MSNLTYDRMYATAIRLLGKYGVDVELRKKPLGAPYTNPRDGVVTKPVGATEKRKGLLADQPGTRVGQQYGENYKAGTGILSTEKWVYLDAKGSKPGMEDEVFIQKQKHTIIDVQEIGPGGVNVLYLVVLKR